MFAYDENPKLIGNFGQARTSVLLCHFFSSSFLIIMLRQYFQIHFELVATGRIITVCNSSCGKVILSQVCVKDSVRGWLA